MTLRRSTQKKGRHSDRFWSRPPFWLGVVVVFFATIILAWGMYFEKQAKDASLIAPWDPSWPPLPALGFPSHPLELIRATYAFAARRPDVVKYLPCYCGCEKQGHESLSARCRRLCASFRDVGTLVCKSRSRSNANKAPEWVIVAQGDWKFRVTFRGNQEAQFNVSAQS